MRRCSLPWFVVVGTAFAVSTALARRAHAEDVDSALDARPALGFSALDRPTGIAEAGFGWLTLPSAQVCASGCSKGDTSFEIDFWQLARANRRFAFGAGILLGLIPTNAGPQAHHSRRYMTIEGTARYYPFVGESVEWWIGVTGGLVVINDRFDIATPATDESLLGPTADSIRTEGGSLGVGGGPVFWLARHWTAGVTLRYDQWFLPTQPNVDAFGNQASLNGRNAVFSLGANIAFRMAL